MNRPRISVDQVALPDELHERQEAIEMIMLDSDKFREEISADLGLDRLHIKGQAVSVNNCWHFYTDGESVDAMFYDIDDFRNGMNRVYSTAL